MDGLFLPLPSDPDPPVHLSDLLSPAEFTTFLWWFSHHPGPTMTISKDGMSVYQLTAKVPLSCDEENSTHLRACLRCRLIRKSAQ